MAPRSYGVPNPYPLRAQAERENARTQAQYPSVSGPPLDPMGVSMPYAPSPNPYPHPPVAPQPQRMHTGRLANRFNARARHQNASTHPPLSAIPNGSPAFPFAPPGQTNPGASPAYPFPQSQNMYPGPQPNPYTHHPGPHTAPAQDFIPRAAPQHTEPLAQARHAFTPARPFPSMSALQEALPQSQHVPPTPTPPPSAPPRPAYLIIGLFALRLTHHLVQRLDPYTDRAAALTWLTAFLAPYDDHFALARLTDPRLIEDYARVYPGIVRGMIREPGYRGVFMDIMMEKGLKGGGEGREMSDGELTAVMDFADAAGEWGSTVLLPGRYEVRIEALARGRRVAG